MLIGTDPNDLKNKILGTFYHDCHASEKLFTCSAPNAQIIQIKIYFTGNPGLK